MTDERCAKAGQDHRSVGMSHARRIARIGDAGGQQRTQLSATPDFPQQLCTAIEPYVDDETIDGL